MTTSQATELTRSERPPLVVCEFAGRCLIEDANRGGKRCAGQCSTCRIYDGEAKA